MKNGGLLLIFCIVLFHSSRSQLIILRTNMVNGDTVYVTNCRHNRGNIYDDGGSDSDYSQGFEGWAVIDLADRVAMVAANYWLADDPDTYIDIMDGTRVVVDHATGSGTINDSILSGTMTIHMHCNPNISATAQGLNFVWIADSLSSRCHHGLRNVQVSNVSNQTALVTWSASTDSIWLDYGNGVHLARGNYSFLSGLEPLSDYTVTVNTWIDRNMECCKLKANFTTTLEAPPTCIDATNLESHFVTCTYGSAENPSENVGAVPGRHTVITNSDTTDGNTGNQLRMVPPGCTASLRLGNAAVDAQGESIIYQMLVDTNEYDILVLRYASVLQVPDHLPESMPRFSFSLYDDNMQPLDPQCSAANFVASPDMGWNLAGSLNMWKDWTTVGVNIAPYHGRTINVGFTTRDCLGGAHFGYAYIVIDCYRKGLSAPQCGEEPPGSLTAPPGFLYEWYTSNYTSRIVSTERTVQVEEPGATYHCRMSYVENNDCKMHISVYAGSRYPLADFDYTIVTSDCEHFNVVMDNHSTVSPDGVNPSPVGERCESAWWDFGNGQTSTEFCPTAQYDSSGTYTVTLISSISNGDCQDTVIKQITLPTFHTYEEHYTCCDSMTWWHDGKRYYDDTIGAMVIHPAADGCDTAYVLHLTVNKSKSTLLRTDTSCWDTPYTWRGNTIDEQLDTLALFRLTDTLVSQMGCDSLVSVEVVRVPQYSIELNADADCHIKQYRVESFSNAPHHRWSSSPLDPALDGHTTDSVLALSPSTVTTYTYTAAFTPDGFCPTSKNITLIPVEFPTAHLHISPEYLTLDNMEYEATDADKLNKYRNWTVAEYRDGIPLVIYHPHDRRTIHERIINGILDSLVVTLEVSNGFCHDTDKASIPMIRTSFYSPNIFTPDKPTNNLFQIVANGITNAELRIYNREGLLVFQTDDLTQPWDGTRDGRPCPQGAYVWHLYYIADDFPLRPQEATGTVTLIR